MNHPTSPPRPGKPAKVACEPSGGAPSEREVPARKGSVIVLQDFCDADMTVQRAPLRASDLPQFELPAICDEVARTNYAPPDDTSPQVPARLGRSTRPSPSAVVGERVSEAVLASEPTRPPLSFPPVAYPSAPALPSRRSRTAAPPSDKRERAIRIGALGAATAVCVAIWLPVALQSSPPARSSSGVSQRIGTLAHQLSQGEGSTSSLLRTDGVSGPILVDGVFAGFAPRPVAWACGERSVLVGFGLPRRVVFPCGGEIVLSP